MSGAFELRNQIRHCKTVCIKRHLYLINYNRMRTQWTTNGNRDAGSSCLCDRGPHRYLQNFGGGGWTPQTPPLGTPLPNNHFLAHISLLFLFFLFLPNTPHSSSIITAASMNSFWILKCTSKIWESTHAFVVKYIRAWLPSQAPRGGLASQTRACMGTEDASPTSPLLK